MDGQCELGEKTAALAFQPRNFARLKTARIEPGMRVLELATGCGGWVSSPQSQIWQALDVQCTSNTLKCTGKPIIAVDVESEI